jgi:hypothetical protein
MTGVNTWQINKFKKRLRPENPVEQSQKILNDPYLRFVYENILLDVFKLSNVQDIENPSIVELGSAGGITKELFPYIVTTDVRNAPGVTKVMDAQEMTLETESVDLFIAKDVLHHLPDVGRHFDEVSRTLSRSGKIIYIEPNWNIISRFVFTFLHPEPYLRKSRNWEFLSSEPMFSNQAMAWLIFCRDKEIWEKRFSGLKFSIEKSRTGIDFLLSGGVYKRNKIGMGFLLKVQGIFSKLGIDTIFHVARVIVVERR